METQGCSFVSLKGEKCGKKVHYEGMCEWHDYLRSSIDDFLEVQYNTNTVSKKKWCKVAYCENRYKKKE